MKFSYAFCLGICLVSSAAFAQTATNNQPVEIKANQALEWNKQSQQYVARGNASAVQEGSSITADELTAEYDDSANGKSEISRMTAKGNVILTRGDTTGTAEHAVYDMKSELVTMTGGNLKITAPGKTVTARDRFEYKIDQGLLKAVGNAVITSEDKTLRADRVDAKLDKNNQLQSADATGNVIITTPKEKATAARATYDARSNVAKLFDNVVITQGQNQVTGSRAEINLNTNVSHMFGDPANKGRVKAVFFPKK